jgi:NSS family neurotransmitter:Na+ symporter
MQQDRGEWGSTLGFVLAAAGSAIGLGNIWRFPYVTGENGGAAFVVIYLICVVLICLPYLYAELTLGRFSRKNPIGAIKAIKQHTPWSLVGWLCVLTGVFILSYYAVMAGWIFGYIFKNVMAANMPYEEFTANPAIVLPLFGFFLLLTVLVVAGGVEKGIERWSKILMPVLLALMTLVIIRGLTLPGAMEGLKFYLVPDFSKVDAKVVVAALGQAFFSMSLGMGAMITYGSYLPRKANLFKAGGWVAAADPLIALLAGFMIFPAVFSVGADPADGPPLVFIVLPEIFAQMPLGGYIGAFFFILLSIAALTSTVSLLEVVVAYFVDERRWSRKKSVWVVGAVTFLIGIPSALSAGAIDSLTNMTFFGKSSFLGIMDYFWGNISLAIGALLLSIFIGWVWGVKQAGAEFSEGSSVGAGTVRIWAFFIRYVCPVVIFIVLISLFWTTH